MASRPADLSDSVGRATAVLVQQLELDPAKAQTIVQEDLAAGRRALELKIASLRAAFGEDVASSVLAVIDPEKLLAPGTHVADGGLIHPRGQPFSAVERVPWIEQQLLEEAVRIVGDRLASSIAGDPALKKISALLEMPESPRARRLLLSVLVEHYGAARDPSESRSEYLSKLGRANVLDALKADFSADSAAWLRDFGELKETFREIEATERESERMASQLRRELDGGVLRLPANVKKEIEAKMIAAYPIEGIGYVLTDGAGFVFKPIANESKRADVNGVQNADDLARMNQFLEASGWFVLGMVHSHPGMRALSSPDDLDRMKTSVALSPGRRTIIAGIEEENGHLVANLASFSSGHDGQVIGEDRIHVAR